MPANQSALNNEFEIACSLRARTRGLFGRSGFTGTLMLVPCHDIHTFGMNRPLDVAFVSSDGRVIEVHQEVKPGRRLRNRQAAATLERFSSERPWVSLGDRIVCRPLAGMR